MQSVHIQTQHLFDTFLTQSKRRVLWHWLTSKPAGLKELPNHDRLTAVSHLEEQTIPLSAIVGSTNPGRNRDFDTHFAPRHCGSKARWQNVATAMLQGKPLPPVELVRLVGGDYYIVDGHHRISVAASLGLDTINANVTYCRASTILKTVPTKPILRPAATCLQS